MRALAAIALVSAAATLWNVGTDRSANRSGWSASLSGERYRVRLDTSKGAIVIAVHRDWAPRGAARFYELVTAGYFDDSRFFRVVKGQWAQFGISGDPATAGRWRAQTIADDAPNASNVRGRVAFAFK